MLLIFSFLPQAILPLSTTDAATNPVPVPRPQMETRTLPPLVDPHLPSLSLAVVVGPEHTVAVGENATLTITVSNGAPDPANDLVLTLPTPDGTLALADDPRASLKGFVSAEGGWKWSVARLDAQSKLVVKANLKVAKMPVGDALLARPSVTARGLTQSITRSGGAVVIDDRAVQTTSTTAVFLPGQPVTLTSADSRIEVTFPKDALDIPLVLQHRPLKHKLAELTGPALPSEVIGRNRGFGAFFLEANTSDLLKNSVHHFNHPLTIRAHYSPQQLEALGIAENDLTLFWWDESQHFKLPGVAQEQQGRWLPISTQYDPQTHTATAQVDHFSGFGLSDGSSPSSAFIPSVQGWQDNLFTGSGSYSYPIALPPGPSGLKPNLSLSYNSSATDGASGLRPTTQAGWVGKGWSLDTGMIATNRADYEGDAHPTLVLNGQSYDLMQLTNQNGASTQTYNTLDESFLKIQQQSNGLSKDNQDGTGRGYFAGANAQPRTKWQVWTKDGTLYEFAEDGWWGWSGNLSNGYQFYLETNRWFLSSVTDPHGNTITYNYARNSYAVTAGNNSAHGWVDPTIWPTSITWGRNINPGSATKDRFQVLFNSQSRTDDTACEASSDNNELGAVCEKRVLTDIEIDSDSDSGWQRISQYHLDTDYSTYSDNLVANGNQPSSDTAHRKLTLLKISRVDNNGSYSLPPTSFSYGVFDGVNAGWTQSGGYNRLIKVDNGQGGIINLTYESIGRSYALNSNAPGAWHTRFSNNHRLVSKIITDANNHTSGYGYSYGTPAYNSLGNDSQFQDSSSPRPYPNSAVLYLNAFTPRNNFPNRDVYPLHRSNTEFRGHDTVTETLPYGNQVVHTFY